MTPPNGIGINDGGNDQLVTAFLELVAWKAGLVVPLMLLLVLEEKPSGFRPNREKAFLEKEAQLAA
jgi:hypothetical protein